MPSSPAPKRSSWPIYYQNVNGLRTKVNGFRVAVQHSSHMVYVLTETGLLDSIDSKEVFDDSFIVYRCDRTEWSSTSGVKGGVLIAVHVSIKSELVMSGESVGLEQVWVRLIVNRSRSVLAGAMYIVPQSNYASYELQLDFARNALRDAGENDICILMGDFNLPNVNWMEDDEGSRFLLPLNVKSDIESLVVDSMFALDMLQVNGVANENGRHLDLIFSTDYERSEVRKSAIPLVRNEIHHFALELCVSVCAEKGPDKRHERNNFVFDFNRTNYNGLLAYLTEVDWTTLLSGVDIEESIRRLYGRIEAGLRRFTPVSRSRSRSSHPPWIKGPLINLINRQKKAYDDYVRSNRSPAEYEIYSEIRREVKLASVKAHGDYVCRMESSLRVNPKQFFNYVNDKRKTGGLPPRLRLGGKEVDSVEDMTNLFAEFFSSVYVRGDEIRIPTLQGDAQLVDIPILRISCDEIESRLSRLPDSMDSGPDGLPSCLLRKCARELSIPLAIIFNASLRSSLFPMAWKLSNVRPIFKKGSRIDATNYRCVAKLSFIPKVFEAIVCDHIGFHSKPLIPDEQHGFVKGRSTVTNLLEFTAFTLGEMEAGNQVDVVYNDFSKAFDKVHHGTLCKKLGSFGFSRAWVNWIASYLTDRWQRVRIDDTYSSPFSAGSGVPAGSHLGPILFVIFISDIGSCIKNARCLLYADDLKVFKTIRSRDDCRALQEDLNSVAKWCEINQLPLNERKCMRFTFTRRKQPWTHDYQINETVLMSPREITDLGVTFDPTMSFVSHVDKVMARGIAMLGFLIRASREFRDPYTSKALYCALVRSILEYASVVWSPTYAVHVRRIESLQKRFLLFALRHLFPRGDFVNLPPYSDRLQLINMQMLSTRRTVADVVFLSRLVGGLLDVPGLLAMVHFNTRINRRTQSNLIYVSTHRTNYGFNQPMSRMSRSVNALAGVVDLSNSVATIRMRVYDHAKNSLI